MTLTELFINLVKIRSDSDESAATTPSTSRQFDVARYIATVAGEFGFCDLSVTDNCSVYARCSPENKTQLVQSLQKEGFNVLMCGDGANDCGALKAANVGMSLSQEEASIAAPFTSINPDISCIIELLKEGKCALVTSVEIFKYMVILSMVEFFSMSLMMFYDSFLGDVQSLIIDIIITLPFSSFVPMTPASDNLTFHRPYSNLASFPVAISLIVQVAINCIFQLGAIVGLNYFFPKSIKKFEKIRFIEK